MALIDFTEIPQGNLGGGKQDTFELFAREFLHMYGFKIIDGPDRGPDGGRDIIVEETRVGSIGETKIRWLVSCKHYAHRGKSVFDDDEVDIPGRVEQFSCAGFIGFYSTVMSSSLNNKINSFRSRFEIEIFDNEKIERALIENKKMESIVKRFFPNSYKSIFHQAYEPVQLYNKYQPLCCDVCGKDLLARRAVEKIEGIIVFEIDDENGKDHKLIKSTYVACKGACDSIAKSKLPKGSKTKWNDLSDLAIPNMYLKFVMGFINGIKIGRDIYSDEAYEKTKYTILSLSQLVMRELTDNEKQRVKELVKTPDWV